MGKRPRRKSQPDVQGEGGAGRRTGEKTLAEMARRYNTHRVHQPVAVAAAGGRGGRVRDGADTGKLTVSVPVPHAKV